MVPKRIGDHRRAGMAAAARTIAGPPISIRFDAVVDTGAGFDGLAERIQVDYNEPESPILSCSRAAACLDLCRSASARHALRVQS